MFRFALAVSLCAAALTGCATSPSRSVAGPVTPIQAGDSYYASAHAAVGRRAAERGSQKAKNLILFIGDGMGVSTVTAARIWAGQAKNVDGESYRLAMEKLPYSAFSKTYTHDSQVADSAPTATAMTTGVKSFNGTLGVTQGLTLGKCETAAANATLSLWAIAEDAGLATGVVSTARLTHATPAATYAITSERDWESDADVSPAGKAAGCIDIASQLLAWDHGDGPEVVLGGGRQNFLPETMADPEYAAQKGRRKDGRNLLDEWKARGPARVVITDDAGFRATDFNSNVQVLGLFEPSHMQYEADRSRDGKGEPSIADMTMAAITRLSRNAGGYVLMVEGGRIDHALHAGNASRALSDAAALDDAVAAAVAATDPSDTLIIVTADHSHTLMIQGYPERGNPILGLVREGGRLALGRDGKPYATLGFANGPGSICKPQPDQSWRCENPDLTSTDTTALDFVQPALTPLASETHGGEDVAVFAGGPGANLFSGVIEQNEIFHVMAQALRLVK
ncbi:MAG: alkaline phosphatase [Alphaproteobacteria bacterium]|nr:alkaline phosphatase [Alphaproteobacteria bacterium]